MRGFKFFIISGIFSIIINFMSLAFIFSPPKNNSLVDIMPFLSLLSTLLFIIATVIIVSALVATIKDTDDKTNLKGE